MLMCHVAVNKLSWYFTLDSLDIFRCFYYLINIAIFFTRYLLYTYYSSGECGGECLVNIDTSTGPGGASYNHTAQGGGGGQY